MSNVPPPRHALTPAEALARARKYAPYLSESLNLFPALEAEYLTQNADDILLRLCEALPENVGTLESEMASLRRLKRQAHLIIALCDIAGTHDWVWVTERLTRLADISMQRLLMAISSEQDWLLPQDDNAPLSAEEDQFSNPVPGLFVLALGKYGARELNYSSDIDFTIFFDPEIIQKYVQDPNRLERYLMRLVKALIKGFERMTEDGYIFRTDLRLRPDPRSTSIAVSTDIAERYYETWGQNWERAAMIKARICAGDMTIGNDFIKTVLTPFIWRRNLDYAAIEDIHSIKRQIHARHGKADFDVPGHNIKLGIGGIREIEFYTQVQQLIFGGRHTELKLPRTLAALEALKDRGYVTEDTQTWLAYYYGFFRNIEHACQMIEDKQTHLLPTDDKSREAIGRLVGFSGLDDFDTAVGKALEHVHKIYSELFAEAAPLGSRAGSLVFTGIEPETETLATFSRLGYTQGEYVWSEMSSWLGGRISATRSERARESLTRLAPKIIDLCADTGEPDEAFMAFGRFFSRVNGGVSLLSLFLKNLKWLRDIIFMMARSSVIVDSLTRKPFIIDAMSDPGFLEMRPERFLVDYVDTIHAMDDFEEALNLARRRVREAHFRLSAGVLLGYVALGDVAHYFTEVAEKTVTALLEAARKETQRVGFSLKGQYAILAFGKLGGRELTRQSDLDIMLIYETHDEGGEENSDGGRYFAKLTQRLVRALSVVTEEGGLYDVDMALRPSGRSGPIAVNLSSFLPYYQERAWTWEFMALSRARVISYSCETFAKKVEGALEQIFALTRDELNQENDIRDMLRRTLREKPSRHDWDIKNIHGGMRDIEYILQANYLRHSEEIIGLKATALKDVLNIPIIKENFSDKDITELSNALCFYQEIGQGLALIQDDLSDQPSVNALRSLGRLMGKGRSMGKISTVELTKMRDGHQDNIRRMRYKIFDI